MGMHTSINLPQSKKPDSPPTDAKYINASPDLSGQLEVLRFDLVQILDDEGIKAKGVVNGNVEQFASGFDRLLSEADVQDKVEENQSTYIETIEKNIYLVLKEYERVMNQNSFNDDGDNNLEVFFEKPKVLISDKETLQNIELREKLGLILPYEKHLLINPNLTEDQAKEREEEIQKIKREQLLLENNLNNPNNPNNPNNN